MQHKYLERENQLLLIGHRNLQLLDLTNFKVVDTRPIDLPYAGRRQDYGSYNWTISPDGRHMALIGLKEGRTKTKTEDKQAAWILDLQTGKRTVRLDYPDHIKHASWSKNGKTLMTMDVPGVNLFTRTANVSFWDGETFEHRTTITLENVTWIYLSNDGERFFAASGKAKNWLGINYVADSDSVVRIWKAGTGELEKTISVPDADFHLKTREIEISPDEKFLLIVNKHKSTPSKHRLLAWKIDSALEQKYVLEPQPKIDDSRVVFSPDAKYFALDVGKNLQIYETETGKLKTELTNVELPSWGWIDNETLASIDYKSKNFFEMGLMLKVFDAKDGRLLYKERLAYDESDPPEFSGSSEMVVNDTTRLRAHPTRKMFLTSSNEFVKIFNSRTGEVLQDVVQPMVRWDLTGKKQLMRGKTVRSADWSKDGKTLYVFNANHPSVSLWQLVE